METLILPATRSTPAVHFDPAADHFSMKGTSIPENASEFYEPVIGWMADNLHGLKGEHVLEFHLSYFNSTSLKSIYQLLKQVKQACENGVPIRVRWYAESDDDLLVETVATLSAVLEMPMELVPIEMDRVSAAS